MIRDGSQPMKSPERKLPIKAIELYNEFIHGEISRRAFVDGVHRLAGGLTRSSRH
jgi:carboxymethylenebutenolidase